jgi:glucose-6-phosphate isomerase
MNSVNRGLASELPAWQALGEQARSQPVTDIAALFAQEPDRLQRFSVSAAGLSGDLSRTLTSAPVLDLLLDLAEQAGLAAGIRSLIAGEPLNVTEGRAALHTALRATGPVDGPVPYIDEIISTRARMREFAAGLRQREAQGFGGDVIENVVCIGIGGSHLGPAMVVEALQAFTATAPRCHFVANVDPADLDTCLRQCNPLSTMFIVASKTFSTLETLENARAARGWLLAGGCPEQELGRHFAAVTARPALAEEFGVRAEKVFPMWDWVGGRYSLWSAIGLPVEIAIGSESFDTLLNGARQMDLHFRDAPLAKNLPVLMALLGIWHRNFLACDTLAVIPYDHALRRLPEYLQQLVMESNGKSVSSAGVALDYQSSGILWGSAGTNTQHSFHQLLHQGNARTMVEFILPLDTHSDNAAQHTHLVANCLSQSQALLCGRSAAQAQALLLERGMAEAEAARLAPHMQVPGNRPSTTISMKKLGPAELGALIALYEHRTFCEGWIWAINSFDQYGVELGKELSRELYPMLTGEAAATSLDPSTASLVAQYLNR